MNIATIFNAIATIGWILAVVIVIVIIAQAVRGKPIKNGGAVVGIIIIGAVVLSSLSSGLVFIKPEERGVVVSAIAPNGYRLQALEPGLRWIVPFAETVETYSISKQNYTMSIAANEGDIKGDDSIESRTADGQQVKVDASVIYSIDPTKVVQVHLTWQKRYGNELVRAISRGVIRDTVSQFKVEEVYSSKRLEMVSLIREQLSKTMSDNGLILNDFVLRNIAFSPEYAASVEQKQISEQQAQQAKFIVEQKKQEADQAREVAKGKKDAAVFEAEGLKAARILEAEGEKEARILEAQGEAQALELINEALKKNPDLLTYIYINKLSPNIQVMMLPTSSSFFYTLPKVQSVDLGPLTPVITPTEEPTPQPTPTEVPQPTPTP